MVGRRDETSPREKLRKLYGMLRWLAADRSARTSDPARQAVSVQRRTSVFNLQRTPAASVPRIHLRMAHALEPAARMDASRQVRHDHVGGQFHLAWIAGRRGGRGRGPSQEKSAGLADEVQFGKKAVADLSGRTRLVCFRTAGISGRDCGTHRAWRKALGGLTRRSGPSWCRPQQRCPIISCATSTPKLWPNAGARLSPSEFTQIDLRNPKVRRKLAVLRQIAALQ